MKYVEILLGGIVQVVLWVGMIILVGVIIAFINSLFYKLVGTRAHKVCIITGAIGTPIHELGHALFCVLFGHKITEIKLYQPNSNDGSLGYVTHSYKPKNIYQRVGNFFIGVGPIIFGSLVLLLLMVLMANNAFDALNGVMGFYATSAPATIGDYIKIIVGGVNVFIAEMFSVDSLTNPFWYLFLVLGCMISLHLRLSKEDINGSVSGLLVTIAILGLVPIIIGLININSMRVMTKAMTTGAIYMLCIYLIAVLLALISLVFAVLIKLIMSIVDKIKRKKETN